MKTWWVFGGMGGGFGGPIYLGDVEAETEFEALKESRSLIEEEYESYAGLHGVLSWEEVRDEIIEENADNDISDAEIDEWAQERYEEEIDSWTSHFVREAIPGKDPEDYLLREEDDV